MQQESNKKIFLTALILALFFSFVVSLAAVLLKPIQQKNEELERNKNVLIAAGKNTDNIDEEFKKIKTFYFNLKTKKVEEATNVSNYFRNFKRLSENKDTSIQLNGDLEGFKSIPDKIPFYAFYDNDTLELVVLPIFGNGLWSTMYGFIAIKNDGNTIQGLTFYDQKETPGLGGEVDNPKWKALWNSKKIYDENGELKIEVIKGIVDDNDKNSKFQIDGLSGATMTTKGVNSFVRFWLGKSGFEDLLKYIGKHKELPVEKG
ncbi:MAG: NADH:ubiquinone oxidoreductase, subunit [Deferribacteraceae bacterium]|nr:NADH:ubiquinone oxidoreductase, subunit [Deferribacteraceae bacterium]